MSAPALRFDSRQSPWSEESLINLSESGFTNGVFNDPQKTGRGYKLINVLDMYIETTIDESRLSLVELSDAEFKKNKVEHGEIFFTRSSLVKEGIAFSNIYLGHSQDVTFDGHLIRMRPRKDVLNSVFANYLLRTSRVRKQLVARGKTATMTTIGQADIAAVMVTFPSLPEQTKIANFLTAVDEKLTQLTRKHDLLTQYKKGVMQQIFSQELRFKDDDGREFAEWEECRIGEMANQKSKKLSPENANDDLRCIELEHISQTTGQLLGYVDASKQKSLKSQFAKGDVLFGKLRPYLRKYLKAPFDGVCSTEIWVLRGSKVSNDYLFHFVQAERFLTVANISSGSKMPRADWEVVASEEVEIPCKAEQTKIANFLTAIDDKITATHTQLAAVKQYKQGLLQQMFV
jgi:type I restriction enzyme, S subunit